MRQTTRRCAEKRTVIHDARITLNHEKGTGTAAQGFVYATPDRSLSDGASPFFMTGTVPLLFVTVLMCRVARSQSPFYS
jgi:hypothetical protein